MTSRQRILEYLKESRYSPSVREIRDAVGLKSPSTVQAHLSYLERVGLIERHGPERRISVRDAA